VFYVCPLSLYVLLCLCVFMPSTVMFVIVSVLSSISHVCDMGHVAWIKLIWLISILMRCLVTDLVEDAVTLKLWFSSYKSSNSNPTHNRNPDGNGEMISPTSPLRLFSLPRQPVYLPWRRTQFEAAEHRPRREIAYDGAKCPSGSDGK